MTEAGTIPLAGLTALECLQVSLSPGHICAGLTCICGPLSFTTVSCVPTPNRAWPAENGRPMDRKAERDGRHHQRLGRHGIHRTAAGEACVRCVDRGDGHDRCAAHQIGVPGGFRPPPGWEKNAVVHGMTTVVLLCPRSFGVGSSINRAGDLLWRRRGQHGLRQADGRGRGCRYVQSPETACAALGSIAPLCCRLSRARSVRCAAGEF